ncbi:MAG TPA: hypothetical protein VFQ67_06820 [Allosphingosinicella sp.]|jgi:hypothetical protein|nr:hypothetical protein [Allosphingosinicella sp.]
MNRYRPGSASAEIAGALAGFLALAAAGCSRPPDPHTLPAGAVDARPVSPFGDIHQNMPPQLDGSPFDPNEGLGVQGFADRRIGRRVANFAVHSIVYSHFVGELHFFYPAARTGPGPGMCRAAVYSAQGETATPPRGQWQGAVFAVAGSVAPLPEPWPAGYGERLEAACKARRDIGLWFRAPSAAQAYLAARLADSVVASARASGALPFQLACRPYPPDTPERPRCARDVRSAVAGANPRAIVRVEACREGTRQPCLAIGLAMSPERGLDAAEDQWLLNVRYRGGPEPRISRVEVDDDRIIFE